MSRKCKTPAKLIELLANHQRAVANTTDILRVKRLYPLENQAIYVQNLTEDRIIGQMEGMSSMLEAILMEHNCYAGFHYLKPNGERLSDVKSPDFAEWRRNYMTRT